MAFDVSYIYKLVDNISPKLKTIQSNINSLDKNISDSTKRMSRNFTDLGKKMATRVTLPMGLAGGMALRSAAKMETLETAFVGILGSSEEASNMVKNLFEFTAKTPFQLEGVAKSAKQLLAAGVTSTEMTKKLQLLGDISAAANIPLSDMSQIFAKIKNKGKAMTEEILQMSDRGIPVIDILSKEFNITKDAVFDMASKSQISFAMMESAMLNMTKKGGFAHEAMILQSKTLTGVISTMRDNITLAMGEIGNVFIEDAKRMASKIIELTQSFKNFAQQNPGLIKVMITISGIIAVLSPLLILLGSLGFAMVGLTTTIKAFVAIALLAKKGIVALKGAMILLNLAMKANPLVFFVSTLVTAITLIATFKGGIMELGKSIKEYLTTPLQALTNIFENMKDTFSSIGGRVGSLFSSNQENNVLKNANQRVINQDIKSLFRGQLDINFRNQPENMTSIITANKNSGLNVGLNTIGGVR